MNIDLWMPDHQVYDNQVYSETIRIRHQNRLAYDLLAQLVEGRIPEEELYDLTNDQWATNNLISDKRCRRKQKFMRKEPRAWQEDTKDPLLHD